MLFASLFLALAAAPAPQADAPPPETPQVEADPYEALLAELNAAEKDWNARYQAAETDDERDAIWAEYPPMRFVPRFRALAEKHPGEPIALKAWRFVVQRGRDAELDPALEALVRDFLDEEELGDICLAMYTTTDPAKAFCEEVLAKSPHENARGKACYALGRLLSSRAKLCARLRAMSEEERQGHTNSYGDVLVAELSVSDPSELRARAEKVFERCSSEFADVQVRRRPLKDLAAGDLFELRNLQLGMVAPTIEGEDVDGERFSTADLRGKVVVLDFWGDW